MLTMIIEKYRQMESIILEKQMYLDEKEKQLKVREDLIIEKEKELFHKLHVVNSILENISQQKKT